jgi:hypothetical protein
MAEVRRHVIETLGDPQGVVVFDPSAFPKKGTHSCGVERAWCGRLGKVETARSGCSWPMRPAAGRARWTVGCICRKSGRRIGYIVTSVTCRPG